MLLGTSSANASLTGEGANENTKSLLDRTCSSIRQLMAKAPTNFDEENMFREEQMVANAKDKVLASAEWLDIEKIVRLSGINEHKLRNQLHLWKKDKQIFSVYNNGMELFPIYAFNRSNHWSPYESLSLVIRSFEVNKSNWAIAIWLAGANGCLEGRHPQDTLAKNVEILKIAITDELDGITHG